MHKVRTINNRKVANKLNQAESFNVCYCPATADHDHIQSILGQEEDEKNILNSHIHWVFTWQDVEILRSLNALPKDYKVVQ